MTDISHPVVRDHLASERDRIAEQLDVLGARGTADAYQGEGFADSGQVTAERGEVDALLTTLRETLHDIDVTLAKFDDGTYGTCESCGREISPSRLEAIPTARQCIDCASQRR